AGLLKLARSLFDLGRRLEAHRCLLEALRLERAGERLLHDEHDPLAAFEQDAADPDAVVRGAEGALWEKDVSAQPRAWARSAQSSSASSRPTLRRSRPGGTRSPSQRV